MDTHRTSVAENSIRKKSFFMYRKTSQMKVHVHQLEREEQNKSAIKVEVSNSAGLYVLCVAHRMLFSSRFATHSPVVCLSTWSHSHRFLKVVESYRYCVFSTLRFEWLSAGLAEVESGIVWKSFEFDSDVQCGACLVALSLSEWNLLYRGFQFFSMGYLSPFHSFAKQPNCISCNAEEKQRTIILHYVLKHILKRQWKQSGGCKHAFAELLKIAKSIRCLFVLSPPPFLPPLFIQFLLWTIENFISRIIINCFDSRASLALSSLELCSVVCSHLIYSRKKKNYTPSILFFLLRSTPIHHELCIELDSIRFTSSSL